MISVYDSHKFTPMCRFDSVYIMAVATSMNDDLDLTNNGVGDVNI